MSKTLEFINALKMLGDGRYHYWNGASGVGCSDYIRMALGLAGVITSAEAQNSNSLWAGQGIVGVLSDTKRFRKHLASETPKDGWIEWYHGYHVSAYYAGGQFEAAPESTHYLSSNGKTAVGYFPKHHNCSGGQLTCYYEIIEEEKKDNKMIKAKELCKRAIDVCMGIYGATGYWNSYPWNVGKYGEGKWWFDCLGFVHTMVNGFKGDRTVLGGGAVMDDFVNCCDEAATLATCTTYSKFNGKEPLNGELLQSSGHVGIYIGEYKVTRSDGTVDVYNTAECTPCWAGGCQLSWVDISNGYRYNKKGGQYRSIWNYHGQLGRVDYTAEVQPEVMPEPEEPKAVNTLTPVQKLMTAIEVVNGKWGSNPKRREELSKLYGTDVAIQIQSLVNKAFE